MQQAHTARLAAVVVAALVSSSPGLAQSGALKSGVRGRVVIAPELASATTWPMGEEEQKRLSQGARVRRPTGHAVVRENTEPMPELVVVLEGARPPQKPEPRQMRIEGMRFVPAQVLVSRPGEVRITNAQRVAVTVGRVGGEALGTIQPGEAGDFVLDEGDHALLLREMPFARAQVKVLGPSRFLPVSSAGEIEPLAVEGGEYQLAFYHGARALRVQSLPLPDDRYLAIDAAISANGVVTVSIKDGNLQVVEAPSPPPPPAPPRPSTSPPPASATAEKTAPAPKPAAAAGREAQIPLEDVEQ